MALPGTAEEATTLTDEKVIASLGRNSALLVDTTGALNIGQIVSPAYSRAFRPSRETVPNLGCTQSAVWVRFTVKNLTFSDPWILLAAFPDMDNVELYAEEDSNWKVWELGQELPFSSRRIVDRNLLFELPLPFGRETTFHLRYRNAAGMTLPLQLHSPQRYQARTLGNQLLFGIFFGFLVVLALYHLILFLKIRESGYLHYFFYIAAFGMFLFSLYGLAQQYLWPGWTRWAGQNAPFFLCMACCCRILFTQSVLDSRNRAPRSHRALQGLLVPPALFAAGHALALLDLLPAAWIPGTGTLQALIALYLLAFTTAVSFLSVLCLVQRAPGARNFLAAWLLMMAGLLLYAFKVLGLLPSNPVTEYGMLFGAVGEMGFLFLSLGERIRAIKSEAREKDRRQQAALQAWQEEQIRSMRLELELLKANIQPHFMLNSINAAIMWIREDPGIAERLLHALSRELKLLLKIVGEKLIPVEEEIRICRLHLEVMSLRHDKRFHLRLEDIRPDEKVPPLVFHTLVENGLTHGYAGKDEGEFILSRKEEAGKVYFTLHNDGESRSNDREPGGIGLKYVRARLEEAYGRDWNLDSRPSAGGWAVTIGIGKLPEPNCAEAGCAS